MSIRTITSFDVHRAQLTEEWIDPVEKAKQEAETRKRLELLELRETITRIQQRIAQLEKELNESN